LRSSRKLSTPRWRLPAYGLVAALAAAEATILWLALHPRVHPDYRAFYIDRTTTCLNKEVVGTYRLGETVSFRPDGAKRSNPLKVCGWTGAAGNGTHSRGHTSILRIALADPPPEGLTGTVELAPVTRPGAGDRQVLISVNDVEVTRVTLAAPEPRNVVFEIPDFAVEGSDRLDIRFDYSNPLPTGPMASNTNDRAIKLLSLRVAPGMADQLVGSRPRNGMSLR
jgi:hypothetical protein